MGRIVSHDGRAIQMVKSEPQNKNLTHWAWLGADRYTNEDWLPNLCKGVQRDLPDQRCTFSLDPSAQLPYLKRVTNWKGAHFPTRTPILLCIGRKECIFTHLAQSSAQLIYWQLTRLWNKPVISVVSLKTEDEVRRSQERMFCNHAEHLREGTTTSCKYSSFGVVFTRLFQWALGRLKCSHTDGQV